MSAKQGSQSARQPESMTSRKAENPRRVPASPQRCFLRRPSQARSATRPAATGRPKEVRSSGRRIPPGPEESLDDISSAPESGTVRS